MSAPFHVVVVVGYPERVPAAQWVARSLARAGMRASLVCGSPSEADALRDAPLGGGILLAALADDPPWAAVRVAASYAREERATLFLALGARAHVLGVLAGALCALDCVALVSEDEIAMLDLEAYRLGTRAHLCLERASALGHARLLGVASQRVHVLTGLEDARRGDELAALLRTVAVRAAQPIPGD